MEPLVSCSITQQTVSDSCDSFEVFPVSVRVKRPATGYHAEPVHFDRSETHLEGFSKKSKSRLRFCAANAADHITSQFCMTYADVWPINGRQCKSDLNRFLTSIRRAFDDVKYIWIGEFQTRGAPHFHFFSNIEVNPDNHQILSDIWYRIAGFDAEKHERFHAHKKNFIPWDMGNGSYLCKYLDKEYQKSIPEGFTGFGRWWGNSKSLKPVPVVVDRVELDLFLSDSARPETGEIITDSAPQFLIRTLRKYQLKNTRSKWSIKLSQSMTVLTGASVFTQTLNYIESQNKGRYEK